MDLSCIQRGRMSENQAEPDKPWATTSHKALRGAEMKGWVIERWGDGGMEGWGDGGMGDRGMGDEGMGDGGIGNGETEGWDDGGMG